MLDQLKTKIQEKIEQSGETVIHTMENPETGQKLQLSLSVEDILRIVKAAKAPDDETIAKKEAAEVKRQQQMAEMLRIARIEDESRKNMQDGCRHEKQNKSSTWYGQIHSDGLIHPICVRCQKLATPYAPPRELISGMGIG